MESHAQRQIAHLGTLSHLMATQCNPCVSIWNASMYEIILFFIIGLIYLQFILFESQKYIVVRLWFSLVYIKSSVPLLRKRKFIKSIYRVLAKTCLRSSRMYWYATQQTICSEEVRFRWLNKIRITLRGSTVQLMPSTG